MGAGVIVTVTLNAALHVSYTVGDAGGKAIRPVSRPSYRAGGRGVTAAMVLHAFGHEVLAAGLAGGSSGELIREDLARSGVPTAFTEIRGESRRVFRFASRDRAGQILRFVPGQLLGWSWPDRLRHALALSVSGTGAGDERLEGTEASDGGYRVDLTCYERLLDAVTVEPFVGLSCTA